MNKKYDIKIDKCNEASGFYEWNKNHYIINKKDERYNDYQTIKKETGIFPDELWSLDNAICLFVIPRLKAFKEKTCGHPCGITEKEWYDILDKMIFAFEECYKDENSSSDKNKQKKIEEGLHLFAEHFQSLWW